MHVNIIWLILQPGSVLDGPVLVVKGGEYVLGHTKECCGSYTCHYNT